MLVVVAEFSEDLVKFADSQTLLGVVTSVPTSGLSSAQRASNTLPILSERYNRKHSCFFRRDYEEGSLLLLLLADLRVNSAGVSTRIITTIGDVVMATTRFTTVMYLLS
ncbi:MAG: hypothetical protein QXV53_06630 [Zestosphaera sp.]